MCTPLQRGVLRKITSNHSLNHKTNRILSIEVFSNSIWIVSYRPVKWWQSATQFISSKITFTLSDRFCLVAIQSSCFVEFCMVLALNPISQSSVGTYLKYRDVLPSSCMFFISHPSWRLQWLSWYELNGYILKMDLPKLFALETFSTNTEIFHHLAILYTSYFENVKFITFCLSPPYLIKQQTIKYF